MMQKTIEHSVLIDASPAAVWEALTRIDLLKTWMGEPEMQIDVITDWTVGGPILITAFHHARFENKGTVLAFEPLCLLRYSQLSSVSRLPDNPENHSILEFRLTPIHARTSLTLTLSGFPTEAILKHLDFYWRVTLGILKQFVEERPTGSNILRPHDGTH
jgi:uncharacterized protein YndB with AHSA1/START domain